MSPHEVKLSSADRVLFPEDGITKGDLFSYYERIADVLVPHLKDRPFTSICPTSRPSQCA